MIEKIFEKLEELITESFYKSITGSYSAGIRNSAYHEVKKIVQEAAKNGGWIPCSERLPEGIIKDCLVTLENGAVFQAQYVKCSKEFRIVAPYHGIIRFHEDNPVIAWCELPAPYQKGE